HGSVRDRTGFRIGDLVVLLQAELRLDDAPDAAATVLQDLVTSILNRRWVLGQATEPTVARRALDLLPTSFEPDWAARARTQLKNRTDQLRWAEAVASELELLATSVKVPDGEIRYIAGPDSTTLWGIATLRGDPYLFAFDLAALLDQLQTTASRSTANDADLVAELSVSRQPSEGALVRRSLGPYLQFVTLTVRHDDPVALDLQKARRRSVRIAIVLIAVFLVFVGVVLSARIVGREIENARMKADFAANVSHELRSPITQIRLKAEALQLDLCYDDDDRQAHYDAIVNESERLSRLVDNVLDFAAIERGAKRYNIRSDDLLEVVSLQLDSTMDTLRGRGMEVAVDLPEDLPPVWIDREAIGQVLINLLSNAAKYGAEGKWVGVTVENTPAGVELSVSDRGIGISEEELPLVFDDFFRSTDPLVRRKKGTGIGLAIVRYIVEAHGATITVDSEAGEGTTFTITFPTTPPPEV
ncbi:MAG: HAMP domain-containing histidine kinase, partial [Myxococcales bacterium]|nr:HAMP domain-containing histidine kinase [Myxococcales bacterium]